MNPFLLVLPGMTIAAGLVLIALAFRPRHARLADALSTLADVTPAAAAPAPVTGADRLGEWWVRGRRIAATPALDRQLRLRGRSLERHYALKVAGAVVGLLLPVILGMVSWFTAGQPPTLPLLVGLVLAVIGYLLPDLLIRGAGAETTEDATEALLTYFDLVTLERLANQSGTQSLQSAAALSDVPVFAAIRGALQRARLQQRTPYGDLKQLGRDLELPALGDLADVMRLDESGASLASALRARVRELRDAHLTQMRIAASEVSERMTVWMVVPSLVFGLFFLFPPLLTLATS